METNKIKEYIEFELSKGNDLPFKEIRSYLTGIYKRMNKDKVALWNRTYRAKVKKSIKGDKVAEDSLKADISG